MTAISGRKCAELLPLSDLDGSLARMCRDLMTQSSWASTACFLTWKASATKRQRLKFRLVPSMPRTDEADCGLWQTPVADDAVERVNGKVNSRGEPKLSAEVKMWHTPHGFSADGKSNGPSRNELGRQVNQSLWPTLRATEAMAYGKPGRPDTDVGMAKGRGQASADDRSRLGGSLNPTWVEWLLGFPPEWTALDPSEMPSSRKSSKK